MKIIPVFIMEVKAFIEPGLYRGPRCSCVVFIVLISDSLIGQVHLNSDAKVKQSEIGGIQTF